MYETGAETGTVCVPTSGMNKHEDPAIVASIERAAEGPITVDITTTGRRSGMAQRIEIWVVKIGDRLVIGGTPRPRDWLANLRVDPALRIAATPG